MQEETVQPESQKSLEELLAEAHARIEQQRDTMMRAVADAENARKRAQAEASSAQKYALERFVEGLLPVVDSLEAALKSGSLGGDISGVELTLKQLRAALEKSSIREIDPRPGERFDPHRHQAMAAVESDGEPNTIVSVLQKGYRLHDRVLRPALVSVAKAVEKRAENPISDTDLD
jgi:molecular chaperone GrpE